ncbi:unnamed protein product [Ectocarpus sp. 12 AP-2014]
MAYARHRGLRAPPSGGGIIDSMGELDLNQEYSIIGGEMDEEDEEEETFASNEGSEEDRGFDSIVGALEEAVMDPTFASLQQVFVDKWCGEFEDVEENKLIYTDLFRQYTRLVERHLDGWLRQRIRGFEMETFMKMVAERRGEVVGDVIDILMAVGDFAEFKGMMVAHRKGRDNGLVVTSASVGEEEAKTGWHRHAERGGVGDPSAGPTASAEGGSARQTCTLAGVDETAGRRRGTPDAFNTAAESKWRK